VRMVCVREHLCWANYVESVDWRQTQDDDTLWRMRPTAVRSFCFLAH
jgi:hypothetical protein